MLWKTRLEYQSIIWPIQRPVGAMVTLSGTNPAGRAYSTRVQTWVSQKNSTQPLTRNVSASFSRSFER